MSKSSPEDLKAQIIKALRNALRNKPEPITQATRNVRRKFSALLEGASPSTVRRLAHELLQSPAVPKFVAYELLSHHQATLSSLTNRELQRLGNGLNTWGDVDAFACYVAGPAWRQNQITDKQRFLEKYEGVTASRVSREIRNKLATGLKNPRRVTD